MSEKFKSGRGGKRDGAGRPVKQACEKAKKRGLTLNEDLVKEAMAITGINKPNTAVRRIIEQAIVEALKKRGLDSIEQELSKQ